MITALNLQRISDADTYRFQTTEVWNIVYMESDKCFFLSNFLMTSTILSYSLIEKEFANWSREDKYIISSEFSFPVCK